MSRPWVYCGARRDETLFALLHALVWAGVFALAAWAWPDGVPAWGALVMPAAAVAISLAWRTMGAPRFQSWFLGTQDEVLPVVHVARAGTELVIPALLALSAAVPVILLARRPPSGAAIGAAAAAAVVIAAALAFGRASYRRAIDRAGRGVPLRVAAVSASPAAFDVYGGAPHVPGYSDVDATIGRYQPHIAAAIARGARLIVLPEYAVLVSADNRQQWLAALSRWARQAHAPVVSGVIEPDKNQLVIADPTGAIAVTYDKQHPAPGLEPRPGKRTPPALLPGTPLPLCAVQCVDLDYPDLIRPVSRAGGVLAVPVDDWKEITAMHHRSAVWSAVMAGVPVVRSAGHGISSVYDSAGRVVATADSLDGPVVLVADVGAAHPGKAASQTLSAAA
jgi:predicted amidohydrolase